jgi:hypothetical protein
MDNEGFRLAKEGEERAYRAALEEWKDAARGSLYRVACLHPEITTDDVWADLAERGIPEPRENRAMAGVISHGKKEGWIVSSSPKRRRESNRPVHHAFPCLIWESQVWGRPIPAHLTEAPPQPPEQLDLFAEVQRMAGQ